MDFLGAHMSISGGLHNAIDRGLKAGCGVIQIFTQNANQWRGKAVTDPDAQLFREKWREAGLHEIVPTISTWSTWRRPKAMCGRRAWVRFSPKCSGAHGSASKKSSCIRAPTLATEKKKDWNG